MDLNAKAEYDIEKTCRLCLRSGIQLQSIFRQESGQKSSMSTLIESIAKVEIHPDDGLPSSVCINCVLTTRRFHEFKVNCELSDKKMRHYLEQQKHSVYIPVKDEHSMMADPIACESPSYASGQGSDYEMDSESDDHDGDDNDKTTGTADPLDDPSMMAIPSVPHETAVSTPQSNDTKLILNYLMGMRDTQEKMQNHMLRLSIELKEVKNTVRQQSRPTTNPPPELITYKCTQYLPLPTYEDLLAFDELLIGEFKADFVAYLSSIGGKSLSNMVANLCNAVFSMDMLPTTTWNGTSKKKRMASTVAPRIIIDVCQSVFKKYTQSEIKVFLRKYLMHGTDRLRKFQKSKTVLRERV